MSLEQEYRQHKQAGFDNLFIHPNDIYPLINQLMDKQHDIKTDFKVAQVGDSFLQKPIYKITLGSGPIKILAWSQMHGDEPTATASLFDFINFTLSSGNKSWFDGWREKITLHIVPMLNPDGAELEQRVNAQGIDINRDAKSLQSPEGKLLLSLAEDIKPQFGFNLHSQNRFYSVGQTDKSAVISLLAPAYNDANDTNESRKKAKQLIVVMNRAINQQYPQHVGRYDDTYSYRSFGDLFSAKGISTILIEAGFLKNDQHRQVPRWLTFLSLTESINAISNQSYIKESLDSYNAIPYNNSDGLVDLLLKNVVMEDDYQVDIGINYDDYFNHGIIDSIGDLSTLSGLRELNMQSYKIELMRSYSLDQPLTLSNESYLKLLTDGYGYFVGDSSLLTNESQFPVLINPKEINNHTQLNKLANFLFSRDGNNELAIVEGQVIELKAGKTV